MWLIESQKRTKLALENLMFATNDGFVYFKREDRKFGKILALNVLQGKWRMEITKQNTTKNYKSIAELINDGWIID